MSRISCAVKMELASKSVTAHYKVVPLSDTLTPSHTYSTSPIVGLLRCVCVVKVKSCRETCLFQAGKDPSLWLLTTHDEGVQAARQAAVEQGGGRLGRLLKSPSDCAFDGAPKTALRRGQVGGGSAGGGRPGCVAASSVEGGKVAPG